MQCGSASDLRLDSMRVFDTLSSMLDKNGEFQKKTSWYDNCQDVLPVFLRKVRRTLFPDNGPPKIKGFTSEEKRASLKKIQKKSYWYNKKKMKFRDTQELSRAFWHWRVWRNHVTDVTATHQQCTIGESHGFFAPILPKIVGWHVLYVYQSFQTRSISSVIS